MAKYKKLAEEANKIVESLIEKHNLSRSDIEQLGHLVNLAVRAHPRPCQGTVRKNIVEIALGEHATVRMLKRTNPVTNEEYNAIDIVGK